MKKLISAILILLLFLGIYSCGKDDAASTATTAATDNSSPEIIILPYSTTAQAPNNAHKVAYGCSGTDSSGLHTSSFFQYV